MSMKIGELARRAEVSTSTIRYYEAEGLLASPQRKSGRRVYEEAVVVQLQTIVALQYAGFRLAEIRDLVPPLAEGRVPSGRWERAARAKLEELDATIGELRRARKLLAEAIDCACGSGNGSAPCNLFAEARSRAAPKGRRRSARGSSEGAAQR